MAMAFAAGVALRDGRGRWDRYVPQIARFWHSESAGCVFFASDKGTIPRYFDANRWMGEGVELDM